ncbi:MAG: hypothetical protein ABGY24_01910 [bacterium]
MPSSLIYLLWGGGGVENDRQCGRAERLRLRDHRYMSYQQTN